MYGKILLLHRECSSTVYSTYIYVYIYYGTSCEILPKNLCELCEIREIHLSPKDQKHLVVFLGFKSSK